MIDDEKYPFLIGDRVCFVPDDRLKGWFSYYEKEGLKEGQTGTVSSIKDGMYVYIGNLPSGWHWKCFKLAEAGPCSL